MEYMKRKPTAEPEVTSPEVRLENRDDARRSLVSDRLKPAVRCVVCGADAKPDAAEQLCWVCRRLKISAWRDVEQQMPAQE